MNTRRFLMFLVVVLITIGLFACARPGAKSPTGLQGATTATVNYPIPGTQSMGGIDSFATQTAAALKTQPVIAATNTPQPLAVTATPQPQSTTGPMVTVPPPTPGRPATYKLQKGEYPYCIARRFNVNPNDLLSLNGLAGSGTYYEGLVLKIPQSGSFPSDLSWHDHPTTYTVKDKDTIYTVACYFGDVDPLVIAQVNGLAAPYTLTAGTKINIP